MAQPLPPAPVPEHWDGEHALDWLARHPGTGGVDERWLFAAVGATQALGDSGMQDGLAWRLRRGPAAHVTGIVAWAAAGVTDLCLGERAHEADEEADRAESEANRAAARIGAPYDQMARIDELRSRLAEIDVLLEPLEEPSGHELAEDGPARTVRYEDLPEDVRVLISDTFGRYDLDGTAFEVLPLAIASFPVVDIEDDPGDTRHLVDYLGVPMGDFPPVLVLGDYWLDGRHRVAAARAQDIGTIDAIDLTALVGDDEQMRALQSWNLGQLSAQPTSEKGPGDGRDPGPGGQRAEIADDADVGYKPQWPKRQVRRSGPDNDIGI